MPELRPAALGKTRKCDVILNTSAERRAPSAAPSRARNRRLTRRRSPELSAASDRTQGPTPRPPESGAVAGGWATLRPGRRGPAGGIGARRRAAVARAAVIAALLGACLPALARDEPTAPSKLSARIVDAGVELVWDAPAADAGSVTGYEILRRKTNRNEPRLGTLVADTGNRLTEYTDGTATAPGVSYAYRVKAIRGGQRSAWSNFARATVLPTPTLLVGNLGQTSASATITQQHATGFRLGGHGQGYEITSVEIDLAAAPSSLTVSLWISASANTVGNQGYGKVQRRLFDFVNPPSFKVGVNEFAAPAGAFAYPNVQYWIVLSGFGSSVSIMETSSDGEDRGGEAGAIVENDSRVRALGSTAAETHGRWVDPGTRGNVLRLAVNGSRRERGILASTFGQPAADQEIISTGDDCCFEMTVGAADRYLIRGLSVAADNSTGSTSGGFFGLPFELQAGHPATHPDDLEDLPDPLFTLPFASAQGNLLPELPPDPDRTAAFLAQYNATALTSPAGMSEWTAPQGATVPGGATYVFHMGPIDSIPGDLQGSTRGGNILSRANCTGATEHDLPTAPGGVTLDDHGDLACPGPVMAVDGEALNAMVQNLGQTDSGYLSVGATNAAVASQGFTTGAGADDGYRLQGIGVNVEGSSSGYPDDASTVTVALYTNSSLKPGTKLFDFVDPGEFGAGHTFFEAPPDTVLDPGEIYHLVWTHHSGTIHRLRRTSTNGEDAGKLSGFSIANAFHFGASVDNLAEPSHGDSLEIAVYGEAIGEEPPNAMVANVGQNNDGHVEASSAAQVVSQGFRTGSYGPGYRLQGIAVNVEGSSSGYPDDGTKVSVALYTDSNGKPGSTLYDLADPADFGVGHTFFEAPAGASLRANTSYVVVWTHHGGTNHRLQTTDSDDEDLVRLPDFSIADSLYHGANQSSLSAHTDGNVLEIAVYGTVPERVEGGFQVTRDWSHMPAGVAVGSQFRVVFIAGLTDATSRGDRAYNAVVRRSAAHEANDGFVRSIAREFKAVVCTQEIDARMNTGMTDSGGLPVHWLDGGWDDRPTLIADSYDQFYGGEWKNTGYGAYSTGNSMEMHERRRIWTGCLATGVSNPDAYLGSTLPMGLVAAGHPNHPTDENLGPIGAIDPSKAYLAFDKSMRLTLYAVSPVLTVVE